MQWLEERLNIAKKIMTKWYYYGFKETGYLWKQKKPLKGNPSSEYHLWILDKKEAKAIAKQNGTKIIKNGIINLKPLNMAKKEKKKDKKKNKDSKGGLGAIRNFTGSLALSKLKHVIMTKKNKKGKKIKCIVIPIKDNYLVEGKEGAIYMNIRLRTTEGKGQYDDNGFIAHAAPSKMYKEASKKEKEKMNNLPILGNVIDWDGPSGGSNDNSGSAGAAIGDDDDLPF